MDYNDKIALLYKEGIQAVRSGDWDKVEDFASSNADMGYFVIRMYENMIPLEVKCRIALFHYTDKGDFNPTIRKYVRKQRYSRYVAKTSSLRYGAIHHSEGQFYLKRVSINDVSDTAEIIENTLFFSGAHS